MVTHVAMLSLLQSIWGTHRALIDPQKHLVLSTTQCDVCRFGPETSQLCLTQREQRLARSS